MAEHEPRQFVTALGAKLAARSRHVCFFLGAGVGRACGLPDVTGLQRIVLDALADDNRAALEHQLQGRNLEGALSRIRRISALISGEDTVDGLTRAKAEELDQTICRQIVIALNTNADDNDAVICLAGWAARANYHLPVELFTVNYDLLWKPRWNGCAYLISMVSSETSMLGFTPNWSSLCQDSVTKSCRPFLYDFGRCTVRSIGFGTPIIR